MYSKDFKLDQSFALKNSQVNMSQQGEQFQSNEEYKALLKNITG